MLGDKPLAKQRNSTGKLEEILILIRGGGDLGTGVTHRLHRAGFSVIIMELPQPLVIRRAVSFASAVYEGRITVEGVEASLAHERAEIEDLLTRGIVPVIVDPNGTLIPMLKPDVLVDARMAKRNLGTAITDAPIVIGLGPGFTAGQDVHAVIETARGHNLGRMILQGSAEADTHIPGLVQGYGRERVLWAPRTGLFHGLLHIGEFVEAGQAVAHVEEQPVLASIPGVLRGILHDNVLVREGQKVGDIDPRGIVEYCFTISDKSRAIGGGVLEAILYLLHKR
ncbi:MAG: selenium-dependent molybdenum cofactor biosynthesis protein YqeB [Anaerolineae bacterium]